MKEDKKLKELLKKYAMEETREDFTSTVMRQIESLPAVNANATSLFKKDLLKILLVAFVLVCAALLVLAIFVKGVQLSFYFFPKIPAKYFSQLFFFLIAFWSIMLINHFWNKTYDR